MYVTTFQIQNVLDTLPIGYYLGRKVEVKLGNRTCYNLMTDVIEISTNEIVNAMKDVDDDTLIEDELRYNLYHEVSHACITPKKLTVTRAMNIFEDERIESLLKNFYMGVDFKESCKRRNNYASAKYENEYELFFEIVRFRRGPAQFVHRVHELIMEYRDVNDNNLYQYEFDIRNFFNEVRDYFNEEQRQREEEAERQREQQAYDNEQQQQTPPDTEEEQEEEEEEEEEEENTDESDEDDDDDKDENNSDKNDDSDDNDDNADNTAEDEENGDSSDEDEDGNGEDEEDSAKEEQEEEGLSFDEAQRHLSQYLDKYDSPVIDNEVSQLLRSIAEQQKNNGSAINAYSGRFDPRSVVRKDCKYFIQENRAGHIKHTQSIKLNLFIDCSGSFRNNDDKVNTLLKALIKFERMNKHFSFDMIACSTGERLLAKSERFQKSNGGTAITSNIKRLYDKVQQPNAQNINILLYDGDCAWSARNEWQAAENLKTFDNQKSVLILDYNNKRYTDRFVTHAKVIITDNYTSELYKNVFDALRMLIK